ncbi:TPA: D-sedoheptulose 7-phosphate isomerase [Burkholderia multivorans]|uniref:D-sedoheptulose 7-phosphate isomerase n=1 Tax=Burkholderia multivorans TaxID=87883 RepID=UPI000D0046F7|nr:D-sedoheptulose 7-phosphate isomerase [Burkholderia multivorans]MBU9301184.1 D-sedoheptulose 7-phosphate isomerase [Burkholderia multivorans]MBU9305664.1 D-sedoheptulose 7-phosphate isomerase [Burkholderia multivorans]MBU9408186.1 D-sedoheptulose 7-phosphate isomerase [Burkholderia multivorans]MBU9510415.1 D-sedoheptulose 7-phosphate isomerase [Burkholderia multivorans]MDN7872786.1 D-sedoheptulose 7-phosphate isomerase [Burkholderia multivorans]
MKQSITAQIDKAIDIFTTIRNDHVLLGVVESLVERIVSSLGAGGKVLIAGNGGSAADAQHIAGEFVSRFNFDRPGLPSIALTTDTSVLTAIGNDYGYEKLFERQVQALGRPGDVFWGISTSGRSPNVLRAMTEARKNGLFVVGFTGANSAEMGELADLCVCVPSRETPKIQEGHILLGHIVCGLVEERMFERP